MPKYQFETEEKIERCLDCGFYSEEDYEYDVNQICSLQGIMFVAKDFAYRDITGIDIERKLDPNIFEKNCAELIKNCPLKLVEE